MFYIGIYLSTSDWKMIGWWMTGHDAMIDWGEQIGKTFNSAEEKSGGGLFYTSIDLQSLHIQDY